MRKRYGPDIKHTGSCTDSGSDARIQYHRAHIRSVVESRIGSGPISGRWRFGGYEWNGLHSATRMGQTLSTGGQS